MFYNNSDASFALQDIFYVNRKKGSVFYPSRNFAGLSFRFAGKSRIKTTNQSAVLETGSITYIPQGINFEIRSEPEEVVILHLKCFGDAENKIQSFVPKNPAFCAGLFQEMHREWQARKPGYKNRCTALLYTLLEALEKADISSFNSEAALIKKGMLYLEMHYDKADLSVATLAEKCSMSEVYFRKIFKRIYGVSPLKYITQMRISQAKRLLKSGYYRVNEIAAMSGFGDVKYFSTVFKKETGKSPSVYTATHSF